MSFMLRNKDLDRAGDLWPRFQAKAKAEGRTSLRDLVLELIARYVEDERDAQIETLCEALTRNAERARRIHGGLAGRLPIAMSPADRTARLQADDELERIFATEAELKFKAWARERARRRA